MLNRANTAQIRPHNRLFAIYFVMWRYIMEAREKDIQKLCEAVLEISSDGYDNPNGAYETSCPFVVQLNIEGVVVGHLQVCRNLNTTKIVLT